MILRADARHIPLRDGCVQCVVTSPPYWGLRDYGTARWEGGNANCDHSAARIKGRFDYPTDKKQLSNGGSDDHRYKDYCGCGARRIDAQIGLEPTPEAYVATMVQVFREVRRVLRDDGTVWLNLGDSYASFRDGKFNAQTVANGNQRDAPTTGAASRKASTFAGTAIKHKDLVGIPWRVAFALQADGWYLRSDIIWAKPNPMPESVTDRPTRSHEYIFLLTKSARYYYDVDAIKETTVTCDDVVRDRETTKLNNTPGRTKMGGLVTNGYQQRNKRSVWTVNSEPTPEAHFATFPQKLIEPCILAGSRTGDLVFDPFIGSGTVGKVAERFGRRWVGCELSADYIEIGKRRTAQMGLSL